MPDVVESCEHVGAYVDLVYAAARRQVGAGDAGDVAQAVFVVLAAKRARGAGPPVERLAGWLIMVTRYAAMEWKRKAALRAKHERAAAEQAAREGAAWAADAAHGEELLAVLDEALVKLGAADREVVTRRYLQGESLAAVAAAVGMTENAAGRRAARAMEKMRRILRRRGVVAPVAAVAAVMGGQAGVKAAGVAGQIAAAGTVPAVLAKGVLWRMVMAKVKGIGLAGVGAAAVAVAFAMATHAKGISAPVVATTAPATSVLFVGEVVEADTGQPVKEFHVDLGFMQTPAWEAGGQPQPAYGNMRNDAAWKKEGAKFWVSRERAPSGKDPLFVRVWGDDYLPVDSPTFSRGEKGAATFTFRLKKAAPLSGETRDAAGRAEAGVRVYVMLANGPHMSFQPGGWPKLQGVGVDASNPEFANSALVLSAVSDAEGKFSLPPQTENYTLFAATLEGVASVERAEFEQTHHVLLAPWPKVKGTAKIKGALARHARIEVTSGYGPGGTDSSARVNADFGVEADAQGRFVFDRVLPGSMQVSLTKSMEGAPGAWVMTAHETVKAVCGETAEVTLDQK